MEKDLMIRGFYRLSKLMQAMIDCNEKQEIIRLSNVFMDDAQELIALLYVENDINDEDLEKFKQGIEDIEKEAMTELNDRQETGDVVPNEKEFQKPTSVQEEEQKVPVDLVPHRPSDDL
jgi:hypothetical protein